MSYTECSAIFDNSCAWLHFPRFTVPIHNKNDLIIVGHNVGNNIQKLYWSSKDSLKAFTTNVQSNPKTLLSQKSNSSKQTYRRISNIDLYKYFGYRTLKNILHFTAACKDNVHLHSAGNIPAEIGTYTTIKQHTYNTKPIERPKKFFDTAHLDIAYGDTIAPGGIKYALIVVDHKTRYFYTLPLTAY